MESAEMDASSALKLAASLACVVGAILATAWVLRRTGWLRPARPGCFRVLGTHSLNPRLSIIMVEIEDTRLLLGASPNSISLLHVMPGQLKAQTGHDSTVSSQAPACFPATLSGKLEQR